MKLRGLILAFILALTGGCATTSSVSSQSQWIVPPQAIQLAAEAAPRGVPGVFALYVKATGTQNDFIYLNSELDYRDQRCLTIAIHPSTSKQLEAMLGASPLIAFKGKNILVKGAAIRTKIGFFLPDGKRTDEYYYQTHVNVTDPRQIEIRPRG